MPREAKVKYEDIARACVRIIGRGKTPTVDAVYEEVGRIGSRSTVNKLRNEFLEKFQSQGLSMLPASLPEALIPAVEDLWAIALTEAGKAYTEDEKAFEKKLEALSNQLGETKETVAVQEKMLEDRQRELRLAYEVKASMSDELTQAQSELKGRDAIIASLREDKDRLNQKLADERAEADRRYDQAAQDWIAEKTTFKEALETLKMTSRESEAKQERLTDYWTNQVQDARDQVSDIKERMREEKQRYHDDLSLERARTAQLTKQIDRLTGDIDRLTGDIDRLTSDLDKTAEFLRVSHSENAELTETVDSQKNEIAALKLQIETIQNEDQGD